MHLPITSDYFNEQQAVLVWAGDTEFCFLDTVWSFKMLLNIGVRL